MNEFAIRPFHPTDLTSLYRICLQTGDNGSDATPLYQDPDLPGHFYAAPYALLEPDLCFVLARAGTPCGYVLGTRDSARFAHRCEQEWFPLLRRRYPLPPAGTKGADAGIIRLLHEGHRADPELDAYPAHLHIDILPAGQGRGWGRKLMETFFDRLRELKVSGVHLEVAKANANAVGFYRRLGMHTIREYPMAICLGMHLSKTPKRVP